jgi:ABC-2 type transport system permease protein
MVPEKYLGFFQLNPMVPIVTAYRDILYAAEIPQISTLAHAFILGMALLVAGVLAFGALKKHFAEEL